MLYYIVKKQNTFQLFILICCYSLITAARFNTITYKNENVNVNNNCDITLDLSNTGLNCLSANFLNTNCLRNLILQNNTIQDFEEGIFDNQPYLEFLDLSRNQLSLSNFFRHGGQFSLKVLILDHNNFYSDKDKQNIVDEEDLDDENENVGTKRSLNNNNTRLHVPYVFPELNYLSLRNVHINTVSEDWINRFPKLNHLDLSENNFNDVTLNFLLQNISSTITDLVLENVGLTIVRTEHLNHVERINLSHNRLPRLSSHKCHGNTLCFESMDNLQFLSISNCSVTYIEENAFKYMKNLLKLDISNNLFTQIPNKTFNYVPSLSTLDLSRNPLYSFPNIENLQNLTSLILDEMKIKKMLRSLEKFVDLPRLKYLSIRGNKIKNIPSTLFENLPSLEKLDLSNNQITSIPFWSSQKQLRQLFLSSNKIINLDDLSIKEAKSLEVLDLKNNSLSQIKITSLKDLPNNDVIIDL